MRGRILHVEQPDAGQIDRLVILVLQRLDVADHGRFKVCRVQLLQAVNPHFLVAIGQRGDDQPLQRHAADPRQSVGAQQPELAVVVVFEKSRQRFDRQRIADFGHLQADRFGFATDKRKPATA